MKICNNCGTTYTKDEMIFFEDTLELGEGKSTSFKNCLCKGEIVNAKKCECGKWKSIFRDCKNCGKGYELDFTN